VVDSPKDGEYYIKSPDESDKVHCVIFVVDITNFDGLNMTITNYSQALKKMSEELHSSGKLFDDN
jgi:hypothetical protein